ncbi:MAG: S-methyl-5-thioribose-1-phosphate isomerase [Candidatus Omnitrophica bacterium]|nr:S-methyl-5-thioribose-1-phosphate isomerase [Candidatus Omnitrophota bacterium]
MELQTIEWRNNKIKLIDQTRLPDKLEYVYIDNLKSLWQAIKKMKVRGAPALGAAAAWGVYLGAKDIKAKNFSEFSRKLDKISAYIASCRPTARNLFWGIERMCSAAVRNKNKPIPDIKRILFKEAQDIIKEDKASCRRIGYYGARLIKNNDTILTICNAGALATIDYGTALGVIYRAGEEGKKPKVFSCETRPMLQGARLTAWELKHKGIDVTLICDSMAAALMRQNRIHKVITGADRISANGDAANKIGTYNLAVLARYHHIPFYIAAPGSTFDLGIKSGRDIPIEERDAAELTRLFFKNPVGPKGIKVFNPAFDVTPADFITAFITDRGVIRPPYAKNIPRVLGE